MPPLSKSENSYFQEGFRTETSQAWLMHQALCPRQLTDHDEPCGINLGSEINWIDAFVWFIVGKYTTGVVHDE